MRSEASRLVPVVFVGKNGVTPELAASADEALEKRELIKIAVLSNCEIAPGDVAEQLGGRTRSEVVQVIGKKIVLYRKSNAERGKTAWKNKAKK